MVPNSVVPMAKPPMPKANNAGPACLPPVEVSEFTGASLYSCYSLFVRCSRIKGGRSVTALRGATIVGLSDAEERTRSLRRLALSFVLLAGILGLAGCKPAYSPNTYASTAAQDEATVERGVIIGVRQVTIAASGAIGAATGGAAGGVAGSQLAGGPLTTAFGAIGGTLVGGIGGTAAAQAIANTKGWEYIVQEDGQKLVSVTQTSKTPLPIGQHVLVIADSQQARIVADYTVPIAPPAAKPAPPGATAGSAPTEINIGPLPQAADAADTSALAPVTLGADPAPQSAPVP
jgi:outer membrane lipoprotein SlyB